MASLDSATLPFSAEAEQAVLGAILMDSRNLNTLLEQLRPEYFYNEQHKQIFEAVLRLFRTGQNVDVVTVLNELVGLDVFSEEAGKSYLFTLAQNTPSVSNCEAYAKIIREKYEMRSLILAAQEIIGDARDETNDPRVVIDRAEQRIYEISDNRATQGLVPIGSVLMGAFDRLMALSEGTGDEFVGVPTGIEPLDETLTGLNKGNLILLAARPGVGKTSFAMNIARNVAVNAEKPVAFFSLEMSREELALRLLSGESGVASTKLKEGKLSAEEWASLTNGAGKLYNAKLYLDETANITVTEMKAKLRRISNIGLVVIDYLQLIEGSGGSNVSRTQIVTEITRSLKIMAKELNVPVLCLSQLNRGPEARAGHKPMLSDLRESGSIEQDADVVMFLYREAYYDDNGKELEGGADQTKAKCMIAKNRHGELKEIDLHWDGATTSFTAAKTR